VVLVRRETAADRRTLTATGASSWTRRAVSAFTAGALGLLGAVLGTATGYVGVAAVYRASSFNGGLGALGNAPTVDLVFLLLIMPAAAALGAWVLAGREPRVVTRQALE